VRECSRCRSHDRQKFRRDGHYQPHLAAGYGQVQIAVPQLECEYGGKVHYPFKTIGKEQRFWVDAQTFVVERAAQGQSYRQIKASLDERLQGSVGLRTLHRQVLPLGQQAAFSKPWQAGEVPPVVRVDGIWLTVMVETNGLQGDRAGRLRPLKQARRVAILAAQGVWPQSGKTKLIAWMQAEDKAQAIERYQAFCAQWQKAQPKAIQTLQRNFDVTLAFYDVMEQAKREGQVWPPQLLRTTSRLEHMFREFHRRFRQAVLFHSLAGAQAAATQLASCFS